MPETATLTEQQVKLLARSLVRMLTPDEESIVDQMLERKAAHADHLERCRLCGYDVDSHKAVHDEQLAHLQRVKMFFGHATTGYPE